MCTDARFHTEQSTSVVWVTFQESQIQHHGRGPLLRNGGIATSNTSGNLKRYTVYTCDFLPASTYIFTTDNCKRWESKTCEFPRPQISVFYSAFPWLLRFVNPVMEIRKCNLLGQRKFELPSFAYTPIHPHVFGSAWPSQSISTSTKDINKYLLNSVWRN